MSIMINVSLLFSSDAATRFSALVPHARDTWHRGRKRRRRWVQNTHSPGSRRWPCGERGNRFTGRISFGKGCRVCLSPQPWRSCCRADVLTGHESFPARLGSATCPTPVICLNTSAAPAEICAVHLVTWPHF